MTDAVWASIITAVGMLATSITAAFFQYRTASLNSKAETKRELARIRSESLDRRSEVRYNRIVDQLAELIVIVDPDINETINKAELARLVVGTQMLLDPKVKVEGQLNGSLTNLGMACVAGDSTARLKASDSVIRACQAFVAVHHRS